MMKVAILTQPLRTNYGGILQNLALQQCLRDMGHEACTLDRIRDTRFPFWKVPARLAKVALGKAPASRILYEYRYGKDYQEFTKHTRRFVSDHICLYPYRSLARDLAPGSFDAYVVGSDQVWRPDYNDIGNMFLDFAAGWPVRRVAYAASFGTEDWMFSPEQTWCCAALARNFDAVSVRETSGIGLCHTYLGVSAVQVLDPSMLLPGAFYAALAAAPDAAPRGGLFVHVLDKTAYKRKVVSELATRYGLKPFSCNQTAPEDALDIPIAQRIQPPVEQWLRSFLNADFVVTDSFHATVFSILLGKRFLVLDNPERGLTRIQSLLEMCGLPECLYTGEGACDFPEIDYLAVNGKLERLRAASKAFLKTALEKV